LGSNGVSFFASVAGLQGGDVEILRTALEETCVVAIDLAEIDLVDRDAVMFLVAGAVAPEEVTRKSSSALHQPVIAV